mgnify:CR=1 FL=1|jgi:hypothetical protein
MSGWIIAGLMAALALGALHRSGRCSRLALELAAALLLAGLAGYAWQGSPAMPGQPAAASAR